MFVKMLLINKFGMLTLGIIILFLIIITVTKAIESDSEGDIEITRGLLKPEWLYVCIYIYIFMYLLSF